MLGELQSFRWHKGLHCNNSLFCEGPEARSTQPRGPQLELTPHHTSSCVAMDRQQRQGGEATVPSFDQ